MRIPTNEEWSFPNINKSIRILFTEYSTKRDFPNIGVTAKRGPPNTGRVLIHANPHSREVEFSEHREGIDLRESSSQNAERSEALRTYTGYWSTRILFWEWSTKRGSSTRELIHWYTQILTHGKWSCSSMFEAVRNYAEYWRKWILCMECLTRRSFPNIGRVWFMQISSRSFPRRAFRT